MYGDIWKNQSENKYCKIVRNKEKNDECSFDMMRLIGKKSKLSFFPENRKYKIIPISINSWGPFIYDVTRFLAPPPPLPLFLPTPSLARHISSHIYQLSLIFHFGHGGKFGLSLRYASNFFLDRENREGYLLNVEDPRLLSVRRTNHLENLHVTCTSYIVNI